MYADNIKFDRESLEAKKLNRVFDYLRLAFPEKTPELERYNVITLYCLVSRLIESYVHHGTENQLADWFIQFESERRQQEDLPEEEQDPS